MSDPRDEGSGTGLERVIFFSDAVFTIVITLLVLPPAVLIWVVLLPAARALVERVLAQRHPSPAS